MVELHEYVFFLLPCYGASRLSPRAQVRTRPPHPPKPLVLAVIKSPAFFYDHYIESRRSDCEQTMVIHACVNSFIKHYLVQFENKFI